MDKVELSWLPPESARITAAIRQRWDIGLGAYIRPKS
jgi:hypothetical protein